MRKSVFEKEKNLIQSQYVATHTLNASIDFQLFFENHFDYLFVKEDKTLFKKLFSNGDYFFSKS